MIFAVLSLGIVALIMSAYNNPVQLSSYINSYAQQENEAEIEADIEQENKCKKDTECENENEINNQLGITNITQTQQQSSLTVKKEIFGCDNIQYNGFIEMNCRELDNDSPEWLPCTDPAISSSEICQNLQENLFDIEVLDGQNTQIQQFEGSAQGTTIENIEPGTYAVNEIIYPNSAPGQLYENPSLSQTCVDKGFSAGGSLGTQNPYFGYSICIQYQDEQGNDCSQTTVNPGENKVCTVKNYILTSNND